MLTEEIIATFVKNTFYPLDVIIPVKYEKSFLPMFLTFQDDFNESDENSLKNLTSYDAFECSKNCKRKF